MGTLLWFAVVYVIPMLTVFYYYWIRRMFRNASNVENDKGTFWLNVLFALTPIVNMVEAGNQFFYNKILSNYQKKMNELYMCYGCKLLQRKHQQGVTLHKEWAKTKNGVCICKDCRSDKLLREECLEEEEIEFAPKINKKQAFSMLIMHSKLKKENEKKQKIEEEKEKTNHLKRINEEQRRLYEKKMRREG